jgi:hypothetical protein
MTIEQTINIPADRRLHLDLKLPETATVGPAKVILIFPTGAAEEAGPQGRRETGQSLCGAAWDSKLTMERFRQMQEEDLNIETEADRRLWSGT